MTRCEGSSASVCALTALAPSEVAILVMAGRETCLPALIDACFQALQQASGCVMATAAHAIDAPDELANPNVVKVVCDAAGRALYFSRAPIPWWRDGYAQGLGTGVALSSPAPLRHVGIYAYRAGFLRQFPALPPSPLEAVESLEQLRVLWHGHRIAVHVSADRPGPGVDTPEDLARVRALLGVRPVQGGA